jgi:hypothetical protein
MTGPSYPIIGGQQLSKSVVDDRYVPGDDVVDDLPRDMVSFDQEAFDLLIESHGVRMLHYMAMRCPIGMIDPLDIRKQHEEHAGCSHGFLYTYGGEISAVFTGGSGNSKQAAPGYVDDGQVSITPPRFYEGTTTPFHATTYDRLYLAHEGVFAVTWETFEANASGIDRLAFLAEQVLILVDSEGNRYRQGIEYELVKGRIKWLGNVRPLVSHPSTGKGSVCSARYLYRPYWYVKSMPHEIRVARADLPDGTSIVQRMPQHLQLQREWLFEAELAPSVDSVAANPVSDRQAPTPRVGSFGPR